MKTIKEIVIDTVLNNTDTNHFLDFPDTSHHTKVVILSILGMTRSEGQ